MFLSYYIIIILYDYTGILLYHSPRWFCRLFDKSRNQDKKRKNFYLGIWIEATSWKRDSSVRIFNRKKTNFVGSWVHDEIDENNCDVIKLSEVFILHWPYRDLSHHLNKINK